MTGPNTPERLICILGDQLSLTAPALAQADKSRDLLLMAEVMEEASYVGHHKKKLAFCFSAMRHFAHELQAQGWNLRYVKLDDPGNTGTITGEIRRYMAETGCTSLMMTQASEHRLHRHLTDWGAAEITAKGGDLTLLEDSRFLASHAMFRDWAKGRKQFRMEYFYREMRRKTGLLMQGDAPEGGRWNYDSENRKPAKADLFMPAPVRCSPDQITTDVLDLVESRFGDHFGSLEDFWFAVTRAQALQALDHFIEQALPDFGDYQDAMLTASPFLYHSVLAQYLNIGLLDPLEVCQRVERAYYDGAAPLNAAEGFIRQIIGWREYMRGMYWLAMPGFIEENYLDATRPLPEFYWTAQTKMNCLAQTISQTRREAYAHHIQRLMVTGNFAMLAGINPKEVHEWYLAVYADAYEWVEAPNVIGMSQFADGGRIASKPYASSGSYINKMSDYCGGCSYKVSVKTGETACPFNHLYWDFLHRNAERLRGNPRLAFPYRTWDRMAPDKQKAALASAGAFLQELEETKEANQTNAPV